MNNLVVGILAHVDAGKTTLCEGILYTKGVIKNWGRVDKKNTLLDSDSMERDRGITIFSKQAVFDIGDNHVTLLDTPGHVDFSAEMERTLSVFDYAILLISAKDKVQVHTKTLWRLLKQNNIPTFIFVNKMDQVEESHNEILEEIRKLDKNIFDFSNQSIIGGQLEEICLASDNEDMINSYLDNGQVDLEDLKICIKNRKLFPCLFGSALKMEGVNSLLGVIERYVVKKEYSDDFSAKVYKITRDENYNRLTHMKVTGGTLKVKDIVSDDEKINQIRVYHGDKFEAVKTVYPGEICAVTGLTKTYAGEGLGTFFGEKYNSKEAVLTYELILDEGESQMKLYPKICELGEEMPDLLVEWNEKEKCTRVCLSGQMQIDVLKKIIKDRYNVCVNFGHGKIAYKETITDTVIGVGHFEPLRHYAEVHIKIEPGELGSGIVVDSDVSEDVLAKNWIRLITTHLLEKKHLGVLTNSPLTDVKFTIVNGRAHNKHTEGGDFRQATYRAIRQGLMQANSILLEPYYNYKIEALESSAGRILTELSSLDIRFDNTEILNGVATIYGYAPVSKVRKLQDNISEYTHGLGKIEVFLAGYDKCHNPCEVINSKGYNPNEDIINTSSSVFCSHGSGFVVPWYEVKKYMHCIDDQKYSYDGGNYENYLPREDFDYSIGTNEIDEIINKTYRSNENSKKKGYKNKKTVIEPCKNPIKVKVKEKKVTIVDGYNIIFAWDELMELAKESIDAAKDKFINIMSKYQSIISDDIIVVFDGYKVKGNIGSESFVEDIMVVHTKEGETADAYIEKYAYDNSSKYDITVATSDGLIQLTTRTSDCRIVSARELYDSVKNANEEFREKYLN